MKRRQVLKGVAASAVGLGLLATTGPAWSMALATGCHRHARKCKIIGIGGAGCNMLVGLAASADPESTELTAEYTCVDLGSETLPHVDASSGAILDYSPIQVLSLAEFGAGGCVNAARAAALRKRDELKSLVAGADLVFLVAGLGGGSGSGVTPFMARLAREAGALTVATVITPFEFEGQQRQGKAAAALKYLNREADLVVALSNEEWAKNYSDDSTLADVFTGLDRHIAGCIPGFIARYGKPTRGNPVS